MKKEKKHTTFCLLSHFIFVSKLGPMNKIHEITTTLLSVNQTPLTARIEGVIDNVSDIQMLHFVAPSIESNVTILNGVNLEQKSRKEKRIHSCNF